MKGSARKFKRSKRKPPPPSSTDSEQSGSKNKPPPAVLDDREAFVNKDTTAMAKQEDLESKYVVVSSHTPSEVENQNTKPGAFRVGGRSDIEESSEGSSLLLVESEALNSPDVLPAELVHEETQVVHERWKNLKKSVGSSQGANTTNENEHKTSKRLIVLSVLCILVLTIVAVVTGVTLSGDESSESNRVYMDPPSLPPLQPPTDEKPNESSTNAPTQSQFSQPLATSPPTSSTEQCSICYGGAEPVDLNLEFFPGGTLCGDSFPSIYFKDDYSCLWINAQAYWACGCPDLPPPAENPLCSMCADGSFPANNDTIIEYDYGEDFPDYVPYRNITCKARATFLSYNDPEPGNTVPFETCEGFQRAFGEVCGCPDA